MPQPSNFGGPPLPAGYSYGGPGFSLLDSYGPRDPFASSFSSSSISGPASAAMAGGGLVMGAVAGVVGLAALATTRAVDAVIGPHTGVYTASSATRPAPHTTTTTTMTVTQPQPQPQHPNYQQQQTGPAMGVPYHHPGASAPPVPAPAPAGPGGGAYVALGPGLPFPARPGAAGAAPAAPMYRWVAVTPARYNYVPSFPEQEPAGADAEGRPLFLVLVLEAVPQQ